MAFRPFEHTVRLTTILILLGVLGGAPLQRAAAGSVEDPPVTTAPAGWVVFSPAKPYQALLRCASFSSREWGVSLDGEEITITARGKGQQGGGPRRMQFRGGLLTGRDHGEFGGGLSWSSADGSLTAEISRDNVLGFVETAFGTLALTGLDHMGMRSGAVLLIAPDGPLPPTASILANLGEAPYAFTKDAQGNVIVVTGSKLLRITPPGTIDTMFSTDYGQLYPNSVVIAKSGAIYVGMRHIVTRIIRAGGQYREDWLVPADCQKFEQKGYDCVCVK